MAQSESPLSLEAVPALEDGNSAVVARLRNKGKEPVVVVLHEYFCQIEARLFNEKGKLLEARDQRAARGRARTPEKLDPVTIAPGAAVDVQTFTVIDEYASAISGPQSWELQDLAGQTLQVDFSYTLPKEVLEFVGKIGAPGALAGTWKSPKVAVPTTKLKQKQVDNVLSSRRQVQDAGAIPLLVKALARKDEVVREYAAVSLGDLKATVAASALAGLLRKDPERVVRICAARALGQLAAPDTREALMAAARDDEDSLVRSSSEDALKKLPR